MERMKKKVVRAMTRRPRVEMTRRMLDSLDSSRDCAVSVERWVTRLLIAQTRRTREIADQVEDFKVEEGTSVEMEGSKETTIDSAAMVEGSPASVMSVASMATKLWIVERRTRTEAIKPWKERSDW